MPDSRPLFTRATDTASRHAVFADYVTRRVTPLLRALMALAAFAYAAATLASALASASTVTLAVRLAPLAPMLATALVARRTERRTTLVLLSLLYLVLLEIGVDLNALGYADAASWMLPGCLLVPVGCSMIWPRLQDFAAAMAICALGPLPMLGAGAIPDDQRFQFVIYMSIALCLATVLYTFVIRALQSQFQLELRLREQAGTDPLTGACTRSHFLELTREALVDAYNRRRPVSLIYLDADNFRELNATQGQDAGDRALVELAEVLRLELRAGDTVGRVGGEAFAVLLPGIPQVQAQELAERLRVATHTIGGARGPLTISIGVAQYGTADGSIESLLTRAERALRQAKDAGCDRVQCAAPGVA